MTIFLRSHYESRPALGPTKVIMNLTTGRLMVGPSQPPGERPDLWPKAWWTRMGAVRAEAAASA
jgi:hypothetical protein